jgi:hypothetical protein
MKIAENDFRLYIGLIIFAFVVILQLFGTFQGISFCPLQKTGFMFGLIPHQPLVVQKLTIPHMKDSILSSLEPEEQGRGINKGGPHQFPIKSILSRKNGPKEGAQYAYHENRLQ